MLALAVAVLGYFGVAQSFAYRIRNANPRQAHAVAPWDGRITAALSKGLLTPDTDRVVRDRAARLARQALRQDPTAVAAASTLGIMTADVRSARRLIGYAEALSRRDLNTQIWRIEDAVSQGNVVGALEHYDVALRTSPRSSDLFFPILTTAIADETIRKALIARLAAGPSWGPLFLEYAATNGPDAGATAQVFEGLGAAGTPVSPLSRLLLVDTLVSRGEVNAAWQFYASFRRNVDRRRSRDPSFGFDPNMATLFDWRLGTESGIDASIQQGVLDFTAPASVGGTVVTQMQVLPAGRYRMAGHSIGIDQPQAAAPYWKLSCRGGRELGRVVMPNSAVNGGNFSGRFDVSADCPTQTLELMAPASDTPAGITGQIDRVRLMPADITEAVR